MINVKNVPKLPIMDAFLLGGHAFDISLAHAGHAGPCARPETARHTQ